MVKKACSISTPLLVVNLLLCSFDLVFDSRKLLINIYNILLDFIEELVKFLLLFLSNAVEDIFVPFFDLVVFRQVRVFKQGLQNLAPLQLYHFD